MHDICIISCVVMVQGPSVTDPIIRHGLCRMIIIVLPTKLLHIVTPNSKLFPNPSNKRKPKKNHNKRQSNRKETNRSSLLT